MKRTITAAIAGLGLALAISGIGISQASAVSLNAGSATGSCSAVGTIPTFTSTTVANNTCYQVKAGIYGYTGSAFQWMYGPQNASKSTINITYTTMISGHNGVLYINSSKSTIIPFE